MAVTNQQSYVTFSPGGTGMGDRLETGIPPQYVTSHPGELSLAIRRG